MWKISDLTLLLYILQRNSSSLRFVACFLYKVEALFGQLLSSHRDLLSSFHAIAQLSSKRHAIGHRQAAKYLLTWRKFSVKLVATCNWNVSRLRFGHFIRTESFDQLMSRNAFEVRELWCEGADIKLVNLVPTFDFPHVSPSERKTLHFYALSFLRIIVGALYCSSDVYDQTIE